MDRKKAEKALRAIAAREGVAVGYIRLKIQEAIDAAMANPDPHIREFWDTIPRQGTRLSPEDVICFMGKHAKEIYEHG